MSCDWATVADPLSELCPEAWYASMSLPLGGLSPGTYDLGTLAQVWMLYYSMTPIPNAQVPCDFEGGGGNAGLEGQLVIHASDEQCVIVEFIGLEAAGLEARDGGFAAAVCDG